MKKKTYFPSAVLLFLVLTFVFAGGVAYATEVPVIQITSDTADQIYPAAQNNRIVWEDRRNGWGDIYLCEFDPVTESCTGGQIQITNNASIQGDVDISGNLIVWDDWRNGNWNIYLCEYSTATHSCTGGERQITTNAAAQLFPAISGNKIVWQDARNGNEDIYLCEYSTATHSCTGGERQITSRGVDQQYPAISGNLIVYQDYYQDDWEIFLYDLSLSQEFRITNNPYAQLFPAISGNLIVWEDYRTADDWEIFSCEYSNATHSCTGGERNFAPDPSDQHIPFVYTNKITWNDYRNGNIDIYLCDYSTTTHSCIGGVRQITDNTAAQKYPVISGNNIIWMDERNGNPDIYAAFVTQPPPPPCQIVPSSANIPAGESSYFILDCAGSCCSASTTWTSNVGTITNPGGCGTYLLAQSSSDSGYLRAAPPGWTACQANITVSTPPPPPPSPVGCGCFLAGTMIAMADGSQKPIDKLKVGDVVLSFDEKAGRMRTGTVSELLFHPKDNTSVIINGRLHATPNHPILSKGKWVHVRDLKVGDTLTDTKDREVPITSMVKVDEIADVYNFEVNPYHTYVAEGIIAHNAILPLEAAPSKINDP